MMNNTVESLSTNIVPSAFVLHDSKPQDVASDMIEYGRQKQSFYIFDMDQAHQRIQHFKYVMPRVKIFYAMKSNNIEIMVKLAIASGLDFACASPGEIYKLRQLNVPTTSMIYAMPTKTPEQMKYANETGVKYTTFDSSYELKKLKQNWPNARLLLRIRTDCGSKIEFVEKFGCDFETEAVELLEEAASLGLSVIGVAFYVDSVCSTINGYTVSLRRARALFDHEARAGRGMNIVDIGGGFASDRTDRIDKVSVLINSEIEELFPDPNVQIIAEPGRYICDSSFTLYCSICNVRRVKRNDKTVNMIYINDGIYGTIRNSENWHKLTKFKHEDSTLEASSSDETILWGPSCDTFDRVMKELTVKLPRCSPGDWLVFSNHGANTIAFATRFSSLQIPLIRPVISLDLWCKVKNSKVFAPSDFIIQPDLTSALPVILPSLSSKNKTYHHPKIPTLTI